MPTTLLFIPSDFHFFLWPLGVPSNLRRGHFVSTAAAAHKKNKATHNGARIKVNYKYRTRCHHNMFRRNMAGMSRETNNFNTDVS